MNKPLTIAEKTIQDDQVLYRVWVRDRFAGRVVPLEDGYAVSESESGEYAGVLPTLAEAFEAVARGLAVTRVLSGARS